MQIRTSRKGSEAFECKRTIRKGFEAFESKFEPFETNSKHSNANSNYSNRIRECKFEWDSNANLN